MPARLRLATHVSYEEMYHRFRAAEDVTARAHWQVLWMVSQGFRTDDIAVAVGYSPTWVRKLVGRYNAGGAEAMGDGRRHNAGQPRLLDGPGEAALQEALRERPCDQGLWSGPQVAAWMSRRLERPVHPQRGWEVLRRLGYTPQRPRPAHEGGDPQKQEDFPGESAADAGG